jgi:hypothetical protein
MALIDRSMHKLILRVQVRQEIDPLAWKYLMKSRPWGTNWDDEIFMFRSGYAGDLVVISEDLMRFGYRWTKDLRNADFVWFTFEPPQLDWLERVTVKPLKKKLESREVFQLKGSNVDWFDDGNEIRYRGEDYDW